MQVVEDQHDGLLLGDERQQPGDRLEEAVAPGLGLDGEGVVQRRGRAAQAGDEAPELAELEIEPLRQRAIASMGEVLPERRDERLVGDDRLGVASTVEHGRAGSVHLVGELADDPRLADTGLAAEHDELRAGAGTQLVAPRKAPHDLPAPDEWPRARLAGQRGRNRRSPIVGPRAGGRVRHAAGRDHERLRIACRRRRTDGGARGTAELAGGLISILGPLGHRPRDDRLQGSGHVGDEGADRRRRGLQVREDLRRARRARKRHRAGQGVKEQAAKRVDVGARVDVELLELLRRRVVQRAEDHAGARQLRRAGDGLRQAEVGQERVHRLPAVFDQHVRRLDVAVHDAAAMRGLDRVGEICDEQRGRRRCEAVLEREDPAEVGALDVLHRHVQQLILFAGVVDGQDVRVPDRRRGAALALKARAKVRVGRQCRCDELQRDLALQRLVAGVVDDAHAAASCHTEDDVIGEALTDSEFSHASACGSASTSAQYTAKPVAAQRAQHVVDRGAVRADRLRWQPPASPICRPRRQRRGALLRATRRCPTRQARR